MTARALRLAREPPAARGGTWLALAACAAALFVLATTGTATWTDVTRAMAEGSRTELEAMMRGHDEGNLRRQAAGAVLGLLGVAALLVRRVGPTLRPRGALGWLLLSYLALLPLSVAWAEAPQLAARRTLAFAAMALAIAGLLRLLPAGALASFATGASAAFVLVAIAVEVAQGARPLAADYRFSGLYHPNHVAGFGAVLVMGAACAEGRARAWLLAVAAPAGAAVILLSRTRTALAALLLALAARALVTAGPWRRALAVAVAAWVACAGALAGADALGHGVRRALVETRPDSHMETLTGRTALWEELLGYAAERPLAGYGLGSFWNAERARAVYASQRWAVAHAHSTYVDQLLQLGAVGLTLHLLVMAGGIRRAARLARRSRRGPHAFVLCLLVYVAAAGALESVLPDPGFLSFLALWALGILAFSAPPAELPERTIPCAST